MKGVHFSRFIDQAGIFGLVGMFFSWIVVGGSFLIFVLVRLFQGKNKKGGGK